MQAARLAEHGQRLADRRQEFVLAPPPVLIVGQVGVEVDVPDVAVGQLPLDHPARIGVGEVELRAQCPRQLHSGQHDHFRLTRGNPDHDRMPRKRGYP